MFDTMNYQEPFDNDRYVSLLEKYKLRKPDNIWKLLDSSGDVRYCGRHNIICENVLKILYDDNGGEVPCFVINGKELSWHEFGRMLMTYEGFRFKLKIFERDEER